MGDWAEVVALALELLEPPVEPRAFALHRHVQTGQHSLEPTDRAPLAEEDRQHLARLVVVLGTPRSSDTQQDHRQEGATAGRKVDGVGVKLRE
jgi:hypothetical protein